MLAEILAKNVKLCQKSKNILKMLVAKAANMFEDVQKCWLCRRAGQHVGGVPYLLEQFARGLTEDSASILQSIRRKPFNRCSTYLSRKASSFIDFLNVLWAFSYACILTK